MAVKRDPGLRFVFLMAAGGMRPVVIRNRVIQRHESARDKNETHDPKVDAGGVVVVYMHRVLMHE
jgi:hypothetical protein